MGLFDKLKKDLGDALGGAAGDAFGEKLGDLAKSIEDATGIDLPDALDAAAADAAADAADVAPAATASPTAAAIADATSAAAPAAGGNHGREWLDSLITSELPEYSVQAGYPVSGFDVQQLYSQAGLFFNPNNVMAPFPYDYALSKDGRVAGYVMVTDHNKDRRYGWQLARAAAQLQGVPFINFYTHLANERDYVLERIRRLAQ
ncbi:MAG: hypothetical protein LBR39_08330 [Coriobacteriales bacterium]|nr:hypothetical protein [Coriobacteriales bacterium]